MIGQNCLSNGKINKVAELYVIFTGFKLVLYKLVFKVFIIKGLVKKLLELPISNREQASSERTIDN